MKRIITRLTAALLLLCVLLTGLPPVSARAATVNSTGTRYNIMLVIDGSGSLTSPSAGNTDPKGMRYELIGELMGILEDDGHNIGAIVFSGTQSKSANPSDADMERGIMLNTGLMSLDKLASDGRMPKDYLEDAIQRIGVDNSANGCTDIGTALLKAQEQLQQMQAQNGLESVVFLFTDGNTAFYGNPAGIMNKSVENRDKATLQMSQNGIRLFGAFLNNGGKLDDAEMKRLVCAANGISTSSEQFQYSYVEIKDSSAISNATTSFLAFLGYIEWPPDPYVYYDDIHDSFTIPGIGVEEMNIRLYTPYGDDLPKLDVKITQPDGTVITGIAVKDSRTFRVYKLIKPDPGVWQIDITVPRGNSVAYKYMPITSLFIDSLVESNPAPQDLHVNRIADFTCLLSQAGTVITNPAAYMGYDCVLRIKNVSNGDTVEYPVQPNASGSLVYSVPLDTYGTFEATTVFTCDEIVVTSEPILLDLTNRSPVASYIPNQDLKYGLFQPKTAELDLTQYISDPEDGDNLVFALDSSTSCNAGGISLTGSMLTLTRKDVGSGNIAISATDTQGISIVKTVYVETTNVTIWYIIGIVCALLLIAIIIILSIRNKNQHRPDGVLSITFDMPHQDRNCKVTMDLDTPGVSTASKTNLYKLLQGALRDEDVQIQPGLYARDVATFLMPFSSELSGILVRADIKKQGKKTVGAIRVSHGKKSTLLFNSFADYFLNDSTSVSLDFTAADDQTDNPFDDPFGVPAGSSKSSFFDDLDDMPQPSRKKAKKQPVKEEAKDSFGSDNDFDFF